MSADRVVFTLLCGRCGRPFRSRRIIDHCPPCTLAAAATLPERRKAR